MKHFDLAGTVSVITGGASGIGYACAQRLAAAGSTVVLVDRNVEALAEAALGLAATTIHCDVTDETAVAAMTDRVVTEHGRYDALVTCAGIVGPPAPAWETSLKDWQQIVEINLTGVWLTNRAALGPMRDAGSGRIVNISSMAGKEGNANFGAYSASKAGVIALTKSLAKEVIDTDIRMSSVAPAAVRTALIEELGVEAVEVMRAKIPIGRLGEPEEIASLVHYLASPEASFTSGACFDASGGRATY